MNKEVEKDDFLNGIVNKLKNGGLSNKDIKNWSIRLRKQRCEQMSMRKQSLLYWYTYDECDEYWKAIDNKDFNKLKNLCKCNDRECPACQMIRLKGV